MPSQNSKTDNSFSELVEMSNMAKISSHNDEQELPFLSSHADVASKDSRDGPKRAVSYDLLVKPENYFALYQAEML